MQDLERVGAWGWSRWVAESCLGKAAYLNLYPCAQDRAIVFGCTTLAFTQWGHLVVELPWLQLGQRIHHRGLLGV